jgi:hypothetical protein
VAERVRVRQITSQEGNRLLRIVRRSTGSVVNLAARPDDPAQRPRPGRQPDRPGHLHQPRPGSRRAAQLQPRRVRDPVSALRGGRPPTFTLAQRRAIKQLALCRPQDHDLPFSTWSLAKLAEFLVVEGVVDDISHEGLRVLLCEESVSFQRLKTWKRSRDPAFETKKNRILHLYGLWTAPPTCSPATQTWSCAWTSSARSTSNHTPAGSGRLGPAAGRAHGVGTERPTPARMAAPAGRLRPVAGQAVRAHQAAQAPWRVPRLPALPEDSVPADRADGIVLDNFSPHLSTADDARRRLGGGEQRRAGLHPTNASWLNRIEAQSPRWATSPWTAPITAHIASRPA